MELRWGKGRLGGCSPWWGEAAGGGRWPWVVAGGPQRGQKLPSRTVVLSRRKTEHGCFGGILGPSTVDLVAGHGGGSVRGGLGSGGVVVVVL